MSLDWTWFCNAMAADPRCYNSVHQAKGVALTGRDWALGRHWP
jgi:hypothetical protein